MLKLKYSNNLGYNLNIHHFKNLKRYMYAYLYFIYI